jgi:hypothetical protein
MAKPVLAFIGDSVRAQDMLVHFYETDCGIQTVRAKDYDLGLNLLDAPVMDDGRAAYLRSVISSAADYAQYDPLVVCDLVTQSDVDAVRKAAPQTRFFKLIDPEIVNDDIEDFLSNETVTSAEGFPITVTNRDAVIGIVDRIGLNNG